VSGLGSGVVFPHGVGPLSSDANLRRARLVCQTLSYLEQPRLR